MALPHTLGSLFGSAALSESPVKQPLKLKPPPNICPYPEHNLSDAPTLIDYFLQSPTVNLRTPAREEGNQESESGNNDGINVHQNALCLFSEYFRSCLTGPNSDAFIEGQHKAIVFSPGTVSIDTLLIFGQWIYTLDMAAIRHHWLEPKLNSEKTGAINGKATDSKTLGSYNKLIEVISKRQSTDTPSQRVGSATGSNIKLELPRNKSAENENSPCGANHSGNGEDSNENDQKQKGKYSCDFSILLDLADFAEYILDEVLMNCIIDEIIYISEVHQIIPGYRSIIRFWSEHECETSSTASSATIVPSLEDHHPDTPPPPQIVTEVEEADLCNAATQAPFDFHYFHHQNRGIKGLLLDLYAFANKSQSLLLTQHQFWPQRFLREVCVVASRRARRGRDAELTKDARVHYWQDLAWPHLTPRVVEVRLTYAEWEKQQQQQQQRETFSLHEMCRLELQKDRLAVLQQARENCRNARCHFYHVHREVDGRSLS